MNPESQRARNIEAKYTNAFESLPVKPTPPTDTEKKFKWGETESKESNNLSVAETKMDELTKLRANEIKGEPMTENGLNNGDEIDRLVKEISKIRTEARAENKDIKKKIEELKADAKRKIEISLNYNDRPRNEAGSINSRLENEIQKLNKQETDNNRIINGGQLFFAGDQVSVPRSQIDAEGNNIIDPEWEVVKPVDNDEILVQTIKPINQPDGTKFYPNKSVSRAELESLLSNQK
jgi:hypothetical protein